MHAAQSNAGRRHACVGLPPTGTPLPSPLRLGAGAGAPTAAAGGGHTLATPPPATGRLRSTVCFRCRPPRRSIPQGPVVAAATSPSCSQVTRRSDPHAHRHPLPLTPLRSPGEASAPHSCHRQQRQRQQRKLQIPYLGGRGICCGATGGGGGGVSSAQQQLKSQQHSQQLWQQHPSGRDLTASDQSLPSGCDLGQSYNTALGRTGSNVAVSHGLSLPPLEPPSDAASSTARTPAAGYPSDGGYSECTQLEQLYIRDFALVSEQVVRLGPGLNVITGESGSGKSVLVEAFSQVLGAPALQECVRAPSESAIIEGTFLVGRQQAAAVRELLATCGLPEEVALSSCGSGSGDVGEMAAPSAGGFRLIVRREISQLPGGGHRSRVSLNGFPTSLRVLRELGAALVDTNGQHSASSLRNPHTQLELLDRIARTGPLADSFAAAAAQLHVVEGQLEELDELDDEAARGRMQKLVDAVAKLRVRAGEERELRAVLKKMEARRSAVEQCGLVRMALCGEGGAGGVSDALRTIEAQLNAILAQEEQHQTAAAKGKGGSAGEDAQGDDADGEEDDDSEDDDDDGEGGGGSGGGVRLMEEALEQVAAAKDMLAAAEGLVRSYARRYQFSPAEHEAASDRLARLERLMKQAAAAGFGGGAGGVGVGGRGGRISCTEQLLEAAEECRTKLAAYYEMEGQREEWEAQTAALVTQLRDTALQLTVRRRAAAARLRSAVEGCLRELAMGGSRFDVRIGWAEERGGGGGGGGEGLWIGEEEAEEAGVGDLGGSTYIMGARGLDQVEFLLAAGPAEPLRPLATVASGGESARVMLALKAAPAQAVAAAATGKGSRQEAEETAAEAGKGGVSATLGGGVPPIMILDELDSGIGARLGSAVGSILSRMALPTTGSNSQIICVTHLPQVACYAAHHLKVQKELEGPSAADLSLSQTSNGAGTEQWEEEEKEDPVAAGTAALRVTTTFVPLVTFQERCVEVAAMLGLDGSVAGEMLLSAQNQVAAMYPPSTAPSGLLSTPTPAAAAISDTGVDSLKQPYALLNDNTVTSPSANTTPIEASSATMMTTSAAASTAPLQTHEGANVVGPASSSSSASSSSTTTSASTVTPAHGSLTVSAAPDMASAIGVSIPDNGRSTANNCDELNSHAGSHKARDAGSCEMAATAATEEEDADADLSDELLAGVEAAALGHLKRMEAQAKAAAEAAAAAAAALGSSGGSMGSTRSSSQVVVVFEEEGRCSKDHQGGVPGIEDSATVLESVRGAEGLQAGMPTGQEQGMVSTTVGVGARGGLGGPTATLVVDEEEKALGRAQQHGDGAGDVHRRQELRHDLEEAEQPQGQQRQGQRQQEEEVDDDEEEAKLMVSSSSSTPQQHEPQHVFVAAVPPSRAASLSHDMSTASNSNNRDDGGSSSGNSDEEIAAEGGPNCGSVDIGPTAAAAVADGGGGGGGVVEVAAWAQGPVAHHVSLNGDLNDSPFIANSTNVVGSGAASSVATSDQEPVDVACLGPSDLDNGGHKSSAVVLNTENENVGSPEVNSNQPHHHHHHHHNNGQQQQDQQDYERAAESKFSSNNSNSSSGLTRYEDDDGAMSDEDYLYDDQVQGASPSGGSDGGGGGAFLDVPHGYEDEFSRMLEDILSFSRSDYEGEALRSCEETLIRALRDAGLM